VAGYQRGIGVTTGLRRCVPSDRPAQCCPCLWWRWNCAGGTSSGGRGQPPWWWGRIACRDASAGDFAEGIIQDYDAQSDAYILADDAHRYALQFQQFTVEAEGLQLVLKVTQCRRVVMPGAPPATPPAAAVAPAAAATVVASAPPAAVEPASAPPAATAAAEPASAPPAAAAAAAEPASAPTAPAEQQQAVRRASAGEGRTSAVQLALCMDRGGCPPTLPRCRSSPTPRLPLQGAAPPLRRPAPLASSQRSALTCQSS